jgi:K+ transporter
MFKYPHYMRIFQHDFSRYLNPAVARTFALRAGRDSSPKRRATLRMPNFNPLTASYFLSRQTLVPSKRPGMALWREELFARRCHVV